MQQLLNRIEYIICFRTSKVLTQIDTPSPGISGVAIGGPSLNLTFLTAATLFPDAYTLTLKNRTQDQVFFMLSGLEAQGYGYPRVCLEENYKCSA